MAPLMKGQVCVVTGASRGIGRGIALQLCQAGATVYITGRHEDTLRIAAEEAQSLGGQCVPVVCDSSQENEVRSLFERVTQEQNGRLDVLVNNAYAGVQAILNTTNKTFWELPASIWDDINNVGLRGHYLCSVYGARLMVPAGRGLIVVISSSGGLRYMFNVPYGVGKAACDRLAVDCAQELRRHGVSYVSLWPGMVQTELLQDYMTKGEHSKDPVLNRLKQIFSAAETTEMSGKCVVALATDPNILNLSGKVLPSCDLARRYGLKDVDSKSSGPAASLGCHSFPAHIFPSVSSVRFGIRSAEEDLIFLLLSSPGRPVHDYLSMSSALQHVSSLSWLASYLPGFLRMPKWLITLYTSKF